MKPMNREAVLSETVSLWLGRISEAALAFESRWTMLALSRADAGPGGAIAGTTQSIWVEACVTGRRGRSSAMGRHAVAVMSGVRRRWRRRKCQMMRISSGETRKPG